MRLNHGLKVTVSFYRPFMYRYPNPDWRDWQLCLCMANSLYKYRHNHLSTKPLLEATKEHCICISYSYSVPALVIQAVCNLSARLVSNHTIRTEPHVTTLPKIIRRRKPLPLDQEFLPLCRYFGRIVGNTKFGRQRDGFS